MERVDCPECGKKSVERRAPNRPGNVKLRQVDGIHDEFVCRNPDCKWTGDEEQLGEPWERPEPEEEPATDWAAGNTEEKKTMSQDKPETEVEASASRGFTGDGEIVELRAEDVLVPNDDRLPAGATVDGLLTLTPEKAEQVRDEIDAALDQFTDDE